MVLSIITVGVVDMIAAAGLMLATPDIGALLRGEVGDPVSGAVVAALGEWAKTPFLAVVVISFVACGIAVQGATVRVMYSYSRDRMLPMWQVWRKVSPRNQTPMYAVLLVAVLASLTFLYANALSVLGGLATGGYYLAFLFPICGVLVVRLRRRWAEGPYTFGRLGDVLAGVAAVWLLGELINIAWPRQPDLPWYQNWAVEVGLGAACLIGLGYSLRAHPERNLPNPGPGGQHRTPEAAVPRTTGDPRATTHD
jgi:amino acid transporter